MADFEYKVLWLDLERREKRVEKIACRDLRKWVGGSGLGAKTVYENVLPSTDPLDGRNILGFFTGPLTGTMVPSSGRHCVVGRSPLTGIWGEASVGGRWGRMLRRSGYDALVLQGRAEKPVYIWINDGEVEIRDAHSLWGLDTYECAPALKELTGEKAEVCAIGPAGEKMVKIAGIFTDGEDGRAAARCGLGAVMGAKRVKAVAVHGQRELPVGDPAGLKEDLKPVIKRIQERTRVLGQFGTAGLVIPCEQLGDFPVRNWAWGRWEEGALKISGQKMAEELLTGRYRCAGCPVGCGRRISITKGPYRGVKGGGPEYETLGLMGGSCLIDDLEAISYANELCNRYGIDTIDAGNLIAFAIEAFERGILNEEWTGGLKLRWGDPEVLIEMIRRIAGREGKLGSLLAEGFPAVKRSFGGEALEFAAEVKGLGFPAHDPRAYNSIALGYATANRGACHLEAFSHIFERNVAMPEIGIHAVEDRFAVEGKGRLVAEAQNLMAVMDSLAACKFLLFGGVGLTELTGWLNRVTGFDYTVEELVRCGERIFNLKRLFNLSCGVGRKDDRLPERILKQKRNAGGAADNLPPLEAMLKEYYSYRGWSDEGVPLPFKIKELF
ncbi:MAG: aldehyde ferredoxin oxidoreductase family protein [Pelotomaculum sp.]|uniref:Aldehyde:ferredoxin oxidoreductase n=1 Tax=Pelotomaculum thermopropionicum (strain DSM 13744 / JCM 10971 / SI) TaxID=370438 RepID=A5D4Z7_PELTS|nr:aldehyde ferredoxin oxidoreductase family protein [Pelotomaculum sp.]BAF58675.1 aldehyde:ferredoxin oxidoreductase [Pelotomaculum thermopropionicum SI]